MRRARRERAPLLGNAFTPELTKTQKLLKYFGATCTTLAMLAQALAGAVETDDHLFKKLPDPVRFFLFLLFCLCIEESKRRIVTSHNEQNFIDLTKIKWRHVFDPREWTIRSFFWQLINIPLTIGGTHVFAALTGISLDGAAALLRTYDGEGYHKMASFLAHPAFQIPFILSAVFANLLFFPKMNAMTYNQFKNWFTGPIKTPEYRSLEERIKMNFENKRRELKNAYESGEDVTALLSEVRGISDQMAHLRKSSASSTLSLHAPDAQINIKYNLARFLTGLLTLVGTTISCIGFWSIYALAGKPSTDKMISTFSKNHTSNYEKLSPVLSVLGYASMISLCSALVPSLIHETLRCVSSKENRHIKVSSNVGLTINMFKAFIICGLGTLPFIYQADKVLHVQTWLVVAIAIGSFSIELEAARKKCSPINYGQETFCGEMTAYLKGSILSFKNRALYILSCCQKQEASPIRQEKQRREDIINADRKLIELQRDDRVINASAKHHGESTPQYRGPFSWFCCQKASERSHVDMEERAVQKP